MTILVTQRLAFLYSCLWTTRPEALHCLSAWRWHLFACRSSSLTKLNQGDDTLFVTLCLVAGVYLSNAEWRVALYWSAEGFTRLHSSSSRSLLKATWSMPWMLRTKRCMGGGRETDTSQWWSDSRLLDICVDWWIPSSGPTITQSNMWPCLWMDWTTVCCKLYMFRMSRVLAVRGSWGWS